MKLGLGYWRDQIQWHSRIHEPAVATDGWSNPGFTCGKYFMSNFQLKLYVVNHTLKNIIIRHELLSARITIIVIEMNKKY